MKTLMAAVVVMALAASTFAAYTGPYNYTWDLTTAAGRTGWSLNGAYVTDGIRTNDGAYAKLNLASVLGLPNGALGGNASQTRFIITVTVRNEATNHMQDMGVNVARNGDNKGVKIVGCSAGNEGFSSVDKSWDGTVNRQSWTQSADAYIGQPAETNLLQIDYGYTTAGVFSTRVQGALHSSYAGVWRESLVNKPVHPSDSFTSIILGAPQDGSPVAGGVWGQGTFLKVELATLPLPEPASLTLLALGSLLVLRRK